MRKRVVYGSSVMFDQGHRDQRAPLFSGQERSSTTEQCPLVHQVGLRIARDFSVRFATSASK